MKKNVFILGGSGLVGGNCLKHFGSFDDYEVKASYFSYPVDNCVYYNTLEPDHQDNFDIDGFGPDVIIHCGALTWVDYCEDHPDESHLKTVKATENVIELAKRNGSKIVYISTDYVFDGKSGPYREDDKVHPVNIYGEHKLEAEEKVRHSGLDHVMIRITNVYGDEVRGKNFIARMVENAQKDEPMELSLPHDQYSTPCNAFDIARVLEVLIRNKRSGMYHVGSTDYMNRCQLAEAVLKHFPGHQVKINPIDTATINPPAERPLFGGLITEKFITEFPAFKFSNVDDYLKKTRTTNE